jgi:hypothetical protein
MDDKRSAFKVKFGIIVGEMCDIIHLKISQCVKRDVYVSDILKTKSNLPSLSFDQGSDDHRRRLHPHGKSMD